MKYINRTNDFAKVISSINNYDITYILSGKAFGLTSFMQELGKRLFQYHVFTLNTINGVNVANLLVSEIMHSDERKKFKKMAEQELGEKSITLLAAIFQGIPYAGPTLAQLVEGKELPAIYAGNYSSAIEEIIMPYIKEFVKTQHVLILLDEAQNMSEESYNLVANLAMVDGVKIVLGVTETINSNYIKLKNSLALYSNIESNIVPFGQPEEKLIRELAAHLGLTFTEDEVKTILIKTQRNIHLIIDCMISMSASGTNKFSFDEMDKAVISFLHICYFGLTSATLKQMLDMSNVYCLNIDEEMPAVLNNLEFHGCITKKNTDNIVIYFIASLYHPEIQKCINEFSDILYYKNIVYDYYRRPGMVDAPGNIELLYKLSIEFADRNKKIYALSLLKLKLEKGEYIPEDVIANAKLSKKNNEEIELSVLYFIRERRYSEALKWIESLRGKRNNSHYQTLKSILLNRVRRFSEAEDMLTYNIATTSNPKILNTLLAYFTANCIHTNQKQKALSEYQEKKEQLVGTENWGYFLRNLASAVSFSDKEKFFLDAIDNFTEFNDDYGIYSCKCNWGNALCVARKPSEGLLLLKQAEIGLQQFGPNHLHIIYNDLGVCYLMLGDTKNASKYIALAEKLAYNKMPRLITSINKACLLMVKNEYKLSSQTLNSIENEVLEHPVSSIRNKYFTNRLLLEYTKGIDYFRNFYQTYEQYIDKFVNKDIINEYQKLFSENKKIEYPSKAWGTLFSPAGLAYWYLDPLKMI